MPGKFEAGRNGRPRQIQPVRRPPRNGSPVPNKRRRRRRRRLNPNFVMLCLILLAAVIFLIVTLADKPDDSTKETKATESTEVEATKGHSWFWERETEPPTEPPTEAPTAPTLVSTATISATGDVLMHMPIVNSTYNSSTGKYDFTGIFQYLDDYAAEADYAVANLETTLAGTDNGYKYSGYPCFNCPDEIAQALKDAGFDMLLTANNHCYDTRTVGLTRTLKIASGLGFDTLGTHATADAPKYLVKDINGIQVGMLCYSYATPDDYPDRASMNGILTGTDAAGLINYFDYDALDLFYNQVAGYMDEMEAAGAEAMVMYIHWGEEYQLKANSNQTAIAQKLCDLGIDVIVGGHPHVVQPMELLTSTADPDHKTVCLYSMGNAVSNQRKTNMNLTTGHTEDGVLFSFTFAEYSDGTVVLDSVDVLPTWVYMGTNNSGSRIYRILPLDKSVTDWGAAFSIGSSTVDAARSSWDRTMNLVGEGMNASNDFLSARRDAILNPVTQ